MTISYADRFRRSQPDSSEHAHLVKLWITYPYPDSTKTKTKSINLLLRTVNLITFANHFSTNIDQILNKTTDPSLIACK